MGVCNCSMFCCTLLYVHSSIAIILMGKRELIALLNLSSWCLVMVERLFLAVPRGCLQFVIVVFPDHTHLLFFTLKYIEIKKHFFKISFPRVPANTFACICVTIFYTLYGSGLLVQRGGGGDVQQPKNPGPKPMKCLFYRIRN